MRRVTRAVFYIIIFTMVACSYSDGVRISDQSYFPLRVGNFRIYQINETDIKQLTCGTGGETIKNYQLKELATDSSKNIEGGYSYVIHRYTRPDSTKPWTNLDTRSARVNANQVIENENNISFVKFIFPLVNNSKWNGNLYNDLGDEIYTLDSLTHTFTIASKKFQNAFTVAQSDNKDYFVYQDKRLEVYAPSIGLIYKQTIQLNYFTDDQTCYGKQEVKDGIIYLQSLLDYGHQ